MNRVALKHHRETVYLGRTNSLRFEFEAGGVPVSWDNVAAWRLSLVAAETVAGPFESGDHAGMVTPVEAGILDLVLGDLEIDPGEYRLRLAARDGSGEWSQVAHEGNLRDVIVLRFVETTEAA